MGLYEKIHGDMITEYKNKNTQISSMLKFILAEIQRSPTKDYSDEAITLVIKRSVNSFSENIYVDHTSEIAYLEDNYLPKKISEENVLEFLKTIDFTQLANKKMAVGKVKAHFPPGSLDMKMVNNLVDTF